jgi:hypothetical protein
LVRFLSFGNGRTSRAEGQAPPSPARALA